MNPENPSGKIDRQYIAIQTEPGEQTRVIHFAHLLFWVGHRDLRTRLTPILQTADLICVKLNSKDGRLCVSMPLGGNHFHSDRDEMRVEYGKYPKITLFANSKRVEGAGEKTIVSPEDLAIIWAKLIKIITSHDPHIINLSFYWFNQPRQQVSFEIITYDKMRSLKIYQENAPRRQSKHVIYHEHDKPKKKDDVRRKTRYWEKYTDD